MLYYNLTHSLHDLGYYVEIYDFDGKDIAVSPVYINKHQAVKWRIDNYLNARMEY